MSRRLLIEACVIEKWRSEENLIKFFQSLRFDVLDEDGVGRRKLVTQKYTRSNSNQALV